MGRPPKKAGSVYHYEYYRSLHDLRLGPLYDLSLAIFSTAGFAVHGFHFVAFVHSAGTDCESLQLLFMAVSFHVYGTSLVICLLFSGNSPSGFDDFHAASREKLWEKMMERGSRSDSVGLPGEGYRILKRMGVWHFDLHVLVTVS